MWGCVVALAVTIPLVFGWVEFRTEPADLGTYRIYAFGFPQAAFPIDSVTGFITFHILVWPSLLIVVGVFLALRRRLHDEGAAAIQQFGEDFLPLVLLFAVSATGLMLTASYTWMKGQAYDFLAILHAVCVIFTLLWLPFGKLFHIFQRPAHLAVAVYKEAGRRSEQAECRRCGEAFASLMHVRDLITVENQLGYRYETKRADVEHYQWVCPRCRRALFGLAQAQLWVTDGQHVSPGGAVVHSQGCEPLDGVGELAAPSVAPPGLESGRRDAADAIQGFTPLAIDRRPSGAKDGGRVTWPRPPPPTPTLPISSAPIWRIRSARTRGRPPSRTASSRRIAASAASSAAFSSR